jgi:hypothetical protein
MAAARNYVVISEKFDIDKMRIEVSSSKNEHTTTTTTTTNTITHNSSYSNM